MFRKSIPIALLGTLALFSCNKNGGFKKTKSGLQYRIVKDEKKGANAQVGDLLMAHVTLRIGDSILKDSRKESGGQPIELPVLTNEFNGDWWEGLPMLTAGDSAVFRTPVDSLLKNNPEAAAQNAFLKKGTFLEYDVKVVSIKQDAQVKAQIMEMIQRRDMMKQMQNNPQMQQQMQQPQQPAVDPAQQASIDDQTMKDYFTQNKLSPKKTASGLYYIVDNPGSGAALTPGQTVAVNYTGRTLDGNAFDSNIDPKFSHVEPFNFALGKGQVIPGWDEGVALVKKGGKIRLFIPSGMAYGPQGQGDIAPNSILTFDVEVTDAK